MHILSRDRSALADWRVVGNHLVLLDVAGTTLSSVQFGFPLDTPKYATHEGRTVRSGSLLVDVDGDGRDELLFGADAPGTHQMEGFYLVNADASQRWNIRPQDSVVFNGIRYGPPWQPHASAVVRSESGKPRLLLSFIHGDRSPSVVITTDASGRELSKYWQDGYVTFMFQAPWKGRSTIFVGGVNDETRGASLAIFDGGIVEGSAPGFDAHRNCTGCPRGTPAFFLVFPPRCIADALPGGGTAKSQSATVETAWVERGEDLHVDVAEGDADGEGHRPAVVKYRISPDLAVLAADPTTGLRVVHDRLQRQGVLDHPLNPEREGVSWRDVKLWTPAAGWTTGKVGAATSSGNPSREPLRIPRHATLRRGRRWPRMARRALYLNR